MKQFKIIAFCAVVSLFACSKAKNSNDAQVETAANQGSTEGDMAKSSATEESPSSALEAKEVISSSAAVVNPKDTTHQFIRTADLRFRVKEVAKATYAIEDITARQGGFVTNMNLMSTTDYTESTNISADSALEVIHFTVSNTMTIRVPNVRLDTTLKEIAKLIDYLDHRIITANDVGLSILSNNMAQRRLARNEQRLIDAIENRGKKLDETANAEELLINKQEQADKAKIDNLSLKDQIQFSTVNLNLYQRQATKKTIIARNESVYQQQPFFYRFKESFSFGWTIIKELFLAICELWAFILIGILGYLGYKRFKKKA